MNNSQANDKPKDHRDSEGENISKLEIMHYLGFELERANNLKETKLRSDITFRFLTVLVGISVLGFLGIFLFNIVGSIIGYTSNFEPTFQLVAFVVPITSITVITLTLLIGGARIAKEKSKENYLDIILQLLNNLKLRSNKD